MWNEAYNETEICVFCFFSSSDSFCLIASHFCLSPVSKHNFQTVLRAFLQIGQTFLTSVMKIVLNVSQCSIMQRNKFNCFSGSERQGNQSNLLYGWINGKWCYVSECLAWRVKCLKGFTLICLHLGSFHIWTLNISHWLCVPM